MCARWAERMEVAAAFQNRLDRRRRYRRAARDAAEPARRFWCGWSIWAFLIR